MIASFVFVFSSFSHVPLDLKPPRPAKIDFESVFQKRNARVGRAMLNFNLRSPERFSAGAMTNPADMYERQFLRGLSGPMADAGSLSAGLALFAALTVLVARAPEPLRVLFDNDARLGPAILRDGGFGAGLGYRW